MKCTVLVQLAKIVQLPHGAYFTVLCGILGYKMICEECFVVKAFFPFVLFISPCRELLPCSFTAFHYSYLGGENSNCLLSCLLVS